MVCPTWTRGAVKQSWRTICAHPARPIALRCCCNPAVLQSSLLGSPDRRQICSSIKRDPRGAPISENNQSQCPDPELFPVIRCHQLLRGFAAAPRLRLFGLPARHPFTQSNLRLLQFLTESLDHQFKFRSVLAGQFNDLRLFVVECLLTRLVKPNRTR
jgi:hypothetical protein